MAKYCKITNIRCIHKNIYSLFLIGFITLFLSGCEKSNPQAHGLKDISQFPFGMAVKPQSIYTNAQYRNIIKLECNRITPENSLKMKPIYKEKGVYNWNEADSIIDFAIKNKLDIHGHVLIWSKSVPEWMKEYQTDREGWKNIMKEYIYKVVGRWKGKIKSWDVVNEAFNDNGEIITTDFWYQKIGPDFIDLAFQYAHNADPNALLFYNDYGHEYSSKRRSGINNMIFDMLERGVPIHGIGLQTHTSLNRKSGELKNAIETAAKTGLKVHISELDVSMNNTIRNPNMIFTDSLQIQQMKKYQEITLAMKNIPAKQQFGITTWGVYDADSWLLSQWSPEWPLLFDSLYSKKKAYYGIIEVLKGN
ncbi:endo-1,4-beta-xylanase [uncultured Bacteroides sp.]|uniref:endo-1,4-beta-xylanase n=1 Tax=uncultured Bacteroides sp. TaxID=162156 RepID=UPI0025EEDB41|nr:endo-1,4-beta-xylanase [uncultured Bacteroides sp.]